MFALFTGHVVATRVFLDGRFAIGALPISAILYLIL
jgi:hypothetical protein